MCLSQLGKPPRHLKFLYTKDMGWDPSYEGTNQRACYHNLVTCVCNKLHVICHCVFFTNVHVCITVYFTIYICHFLAYMSLVCVCHYVYITGTIFLNQFKIFKLIVGPIVDGNNKWRGICNELRSTVVYRGGIMLRLHSGWGLHCCHNAVYTNVTGMIITPSVTVVYILNCAVTAVAQIVLWQQWQQHYCISDVNWYAAITVTTM